MAGAHLVGDCIGIVAELRELLAHERLVLGLALGGRRHDVGWIVAVERE